MPCGNPHLSNQANHKLTRVIILHSPNWPIKSCHVTISQNETLTLIFPSPSITMAAATAPLHLVGHHCITITPFRRRPPPTSAAPRRNNATSRLHRLHSHRCSSEHHHREPPSFSSISPHHHGISAAIAVRSPSLQIKPDLRNQGDASATAPSLRNLQQLHRNPRWQFICASQQHQRLHQFAPPPLAGKHRTCTTVSRQHYQIHAAMPEQSPLPSAAQPRKKHGGKNPNSGERHFTPRVKLLLDSPIGQLVNSGQNCKNG